MIDSWDTLWLLSLIEDLPTLPADHPDRAWATELADVMHAGALFEVTPADEQRLLALCDIVGLHWVRRWREGETQ